MISLEFLFKKPQKKLRLKGLAPKARFWDLSRSINSTILNIVPTYKRLFHLISPKKKLPFSYVDIKESEPNLCTYTYL